MKIGFKTFGCRANSVDTDTLWLEAERRGFEVVSDKAFADAYVINSCTVTEDADRSTRNYARRLKRQNPKSLVAVIGCYGQTGRADLLKMACVDVVLGTADKHEVFDYFLHPSSKDRVQDVTGYLPEKFLGSRRARASIKVQDGCNFKCSYCIIPQARGRSRSLPLETVVEQVREAHAQGFQEVVLTGIHLAHYGWDQRTDLMGLLHALFRKLGGPRVRLSTLDPFEIPDSLVELLRAEKRLCPYFHIALQSGSDKVLTQMRRFYSAHEFETVTHKLYSANPDVYIGVDVIVGFPGETDDDFEQTIRCLQRSVWTKLHIFPFSVRKGTVAETMHPKISTHEIESRMRRLQELSAQQYQRYLASQRGKTKEVLLERKTSTVGDLWTGHTENYLPSLIKVPSGKRRSTVKAIVGRREGEWVWTDASL
ncbi:MAG: tRNA (N(6)-L-threonylcarbamoyladenosine(37)-C(2))-methylthiotransferase MtaB [Bdellovibrionales bacterium]|nr:tRNA (N(6)-L-threonylcarbamoyladenosine(37)-C(2))-methylthiotransferase MtaB [Bdellovibrionales bacterium]